MLREKERNEISVTDLCEVADIERSTLYANFGEISGLANSACEEQILYHLCDCKYIIRQSNISYRSMIDGVLSIKTKFLDKIFRKPAELRSLLKTSHRIYVFYSDQWAAMLLSNTGNTRLKQNNL